MDRFEMSETFVIGAGPAGLAAAYGLSKQGRKSTIIEADKPGWRPFQNR